MKSFKLYGSRDLRAEDCQLEQDESQVIVKVDTVGICGSDIHYYMHGRCGVFVPKTPFSLGHEFSGTVTSVPENNKGIKIGDRVTADPLLNCGDTENCEYCAKGQRSLCPNKRFMGSAAAFPHVQGGMREFMSIPIENTYLLP